jgi:hypothetical protein
MKQTGGDVGKWIILKRFLDRERYYGLDGIG